VTHKGQAMLFVTIEDSLSNVELLIFPKLLQTTYGLWHDEQKILATGKVSDKDGHPKILVEKAEIIKDEWLNKINARKMSQKRLWIKIPADFTKEKMMKLKNILEKNQGTTPVYLEINNGKMRKVKTNLKILLNDNLKTTIDEFLGEQSWLLEDN